jgi:hypothetical protein
MGISHIKAVGIGARAENADVTRFHGSVVDHVGTIMDANSGL